MDLFTLLFFFIYLYLNILLCWHDLSTGLLPDRFTCPLLWSGVLFHLCQRPLLTADALWGAIAGYSAMAALYWGYRAIRHREGLGYGDVKYLAALGAWHNWQQLPLLMLVAAGMACIYVAGRTLWSHTTTDMKNPLPFGPFMGAAGFILIGNLMLSLRL